MMTNKYDELFKLMQENPDLPVLPMVDSDIVEDCDGWWLGAWGSADVDEYLVVNKQVYYKSDDDVFEVLEQYLTRKEFEDLPDTEEECRPLYDKLPWQKAIMVLICLPREEEV